MAQTYAAAPQPVFLGEGIDISGLIIKSEA
jgi:hypothetical protein